MCHVHGKTYSNLVDIKTCTASNCAHFNDNPNTTGACVALQCTFAGCPPGRFECSGENDCETVASASVCTACTGGGCTTSNMAGVACTNATCVYTSATCLPGFADCNGNKASDGCETNANNVSMCGGCNQTFACSTNHLATPTCVGGTCGGTCDAGFASCDSEFRTTGCEQEINANISHCGGCNKVCSTNHILTTTCAAGVCTGQCATGFFDCNSNKQTDGCESNQPCSMAFTSMPNLLAILFGSIMLMVLTS